MLLAILAVARGGTFMIEQPGGSLMEFFPKLTWLYKQTPVPRQIYAIFCISVVCKVWKCCWWMAHYDGPTAKRHKAFTNSRAVNKFNRGRLDVKALAKRKDPAAQPTERYQDKSGKWRWKGTKALKGTQQLAIKVCSCESASSIMSSSYRTDGFRT